MKGNIKIHFPILLMSFLLICSSCGESLFNSTLTVQIPVSHKVWLISEENKGNFLMKDDSSDIELFNSFSEWKNFNWSKSSNGIKSETIEYENISQRFSSNAGTDFSLQMSAEDSPVLSSLDVVCNNIRFGYCLSLKRIYSISVANSYKYANPFDGSTRNEDEAIFSTADYLDTMRVYNYPYTGVLLFNLRDFEDQLEDSSVVQVAIAKGIGLISYSMHNGITMIRAAPE